MRLFCCNVGHKKACTVKDAGYLFTFYKVEPAETEPLPKSAVSLVFAVGGMPHPCGHPYSQLHMAP